VTGMTTLDAATRLDGGQADLARTLVTWLETGVRPDAMLADDVFCDLSLPHWRLQGVGPDALFGARESSHPYPGQVRVEALDATSRGFLLQFEERWEADGQRWYSRELLHCVVTDGRVSELSIYCTGDWDATVQQRHAEQVRLVRP